MRAIAKTRVATLLPFIAPAILSACAPAHPNAAKSEAAELFIAVDGSRSTAFISTPAYGDRAVVLAGEEVIRLRPGDGVRVINFGARIAENSVPVLSIQSDYKLTLPKMRKRVEASLRDLMAKNRAAGGQDGTDMTYFLEQSAIRCVPGSEVLVLSDGLVETESYSATKALTTGGPVHLPPPLTQYLSGCRVKILGVGMAQTGNGPNAQNLTNDEVRRLQHALAEYFQAAGVRPDAISFASVL